MARAAFLQAYALRKHPVVLLNLAQSSLKSGHALEAARYFQQFLKDYSSATEAQRADANKGLSDARTKLGRIDVVGATTGADMFVDDERIGMAPLDHSVDVEPGTHSVRSQGPGGEQTVPVTANAGQGVIARFGAAPAAVPTPTPAASAPAESATEPAQAPPAEAAPAPPAPLPQPPQDEGPARSHHWGWVAASGAVAVVGFVTAIVMAVEKGVRAEQRQRGGAAIVANGGGQGTCFVGPNSPTAYYANACNALNSDDNNVNADAHHRQHGARRRARRHGGAHRLHDLRRDELLLAEQRQARAVRYERPRHCRTDPRQGVRRNEHRRYVLARDARLRIRENLHRLGLHPVAPRLAHERDGVAPDGVAPGVGDRVGRLDHAPGRRSLFEHTKREPGDRRAASSRGARRAPPTRRRATAQACSSRKGPRPGRTRTGRSGATSRCHLAPLPRAIRSACTLAPPRPSGHSSLASCVVTSTTWRASASTPTTSSSGATRALSARRRLTPPARTSAAWTSPPFATRTSPSVVPLRPREEIALFVASESEWGDASRRASLRRRRRSRRRASGSPRPLRRPRRLDAAPHVRVKSSVSAGPVSSCTDGEPPVVVVVVYVRSRARVVPLGAASLQASPSSVAQTNEPTSIGPSTTCPSGASTTATCPLFFPTGPRQTIAAPDVMGQA